jgi:hypothetical protein
MSTTMTAAVDGSNVTASGRAATWTVICHPSKVGDNRTTLP